MGRVGEWKISSNLMPGNGASTTALPSYPIGELRRAREDFIRQWYAAVRRDPVAYAIDNAHFQYPPNIRMKNCDDYPFSTEDTVYQMPVSGSAHDSFSSCPNSQHIKQPLSFVAQCEKVNERISLYKYPTNGLFYCCDNCEFSTVDLISAEKHLERVAHVSCSEYSNPGNNTLCDGISSPKTPILFGPRFVYNSAVRSTGWSSGDTVTYCPTCIIVLPDKLLCAYHHQIQHRGYQAKYAYGHVLAVREFQVSIQQKCPECKQNFYDWREVADHWLSGPCSSPFLPVSSDSDGSSPSAQLTEVVCTMCNAHFDRVPRIPQAPVFKAAPHSGSKRKWIANGDEDADNHKDKILKTDANSIPSSSAVSVDGFARFCLNHAESHLRRCTSGTMICILRVRFIRLEKGTVGILPAYTHPSEDAILLYSMYECKRLVSYLKDFHCHRKSLWRSAKNQLTQILTHSNPYLHSQANAFFIS